MIELGELEKQHADFASRKVRIVAVSNDDLETSQKTQAKCPHLVIASDADQAMARAFSVIQPGMGHDGTDTNAPTTFFVGGDGKVRWIFRANTFFVRLSPDELLKAIDEHRSR
jgi:peroxiredoxin